MFDQVLAQVATLAGFAALFTVVVNVGKFVGWVKDGDAPKWIAGLNLILVIAVYSLKLFRIEFDVSGLDANMREAAIVATFILSFVLDVGVSKVSHNVLKGLPLIGKSYSLDRKE